MEENGRARSPAGQMAMWRAVPKGQAPAFFRPVSGLTTSGWPPSRSARDTSELKNRDEKISGDWPALRTRSMRGRGRLPLRGQHRLARPDLHVERRLPVSR